MTSPSDRDQHPDVEEISDLTEGLLQPSRTHALRQHLDGCALCADVHRSLMEIQDLLGTLPGPSPMPADVAERIDAALAAEALLDAAGTVEPATSPERSTRIPAPSSSMHGDARSRDGEKEGRGVAAAASGEASDVAEKAAPIDAAHVSRETSHPSRPLAGPDRVGSGPDTTGPGRGTTGPGRGRTARRRRGALVLGTAFGVAVLGMGVFLLQGSDTKTGSVADRTSSPQITTTATDGADEFSGARLDTQVDGLLATKSSNSPHSNPDARSNASDSGTATNTPLMQAVPQVPYCVRQGTGRTEALLAAQQGTYQGSPAYLLVLANPSDETKVRVYVIDATCVGATPPAKGKILQTELYSRR